MVQNLQFDAVNDRLPPQNIEAEEAILGGILLDPEAIGRVMEILSPDAFYIGAHRDIYRAALDLHAKGQPTDLMTITVWLKDHEKLEKVGGQTRLAQLVDRTISAANIDQYATLVMDKYTRRVLIQSSGEIAQLGYDTTIPLENVLDQAEQKLFSITQVRPQSGLTATSDILIDTFAEIEQRSLGVVLPGVPCGFYDLDAMTQGFQRSDLIIAAGRPSMGKCLSAEARILLADGSLRTIAEVYEAQSASLLTLDADWHFRVTQPSAFVDDGIKPVFRVRTRSGREIETTLTHPYLTIQGWRPLAELQVGQRIAVPRILPVFGTETLPDHQTKVLAYLIGDSKSLPDVVFRLAKSSLALFLNRLFATDGWATVLASGQAQLGFATVSETLAQQMQHLLLRFGILSQLKHRSVKYLEGRRFAWQIDITDALSIKTFVQEIGIFGKEQALASVETALANRRYQTNRDLIPIEVWDMLRQAKGDESGVSLATRAGLTGTSNIHVGKRALTRSRLLDLATALEQADLQSLATSQIYWDEIVEITPQGLKQVYDLTIPDTHNFVANDICVHNTSFVLNIARNIAALQKLPVAIYSLEMSKLQLVYRLLSSEVEMESSRLRTGRIAQNEWEKLGYAISILSQMPIFIDDTPNISVTEMRSKCRRLQAEQGGALGLILIDYLQLMEGGSDNRVQELSKITRSLKGLARELNVPIIALSQLSRGVESRTNKRPMMSDLRESGCLTGDTLIPLADQGLQVPLRNLVGQSEFGIWALNEQTYQLERASVSKVFTTGEKPVFKLITQLGRTIRATANHQFLTIHGWKRLDELTPGIRIALPRCLPSNSSQTLSDQELALLGHLIGDGCTLPRHVIQYTTREPDLAEAVVAQVDCIFGDAIKPRIQKERNWFQVYLTAAENLTHGVRNPIAKWLDGMEIFGLRSHEKRIPEDIFKQPATAIAIFLRHLWSTDGCIKLMQKPRPRPIAYYASSSYQLACQVQALLLRFEINARLKKLPQSKGREQYHIVITGKTDLEHFIQSIGAFGIYKMSAAAEIQAYFDQSTANTNRDIIPYDIWHLYAIPAMKSLGITQREMQARLGISYCGTTLYRQNLSRKRTQKVASIVNSEEMFQLAASDIYWDEVASIEPDGTEQVYDMTVPEHHNFVANNIIVHNSIEQDADLIMMLYREEYYDPDTPDRGIAEVIVTKHRNGPTGTVKLLFEPQFTRFRNLANPGV